ncbi:DUF3618 domain-containing protein [Streptomyces reniochalinae]|uniref:DUF3618 domain-containing protein n=1 Tax=Streptomyces reniochalinae TaxID=2250578 RepID=A0A367F2I8_9ACTN|nr:DUF3618 domain-containing protein [Streptomyces reniochalinae]RCG24533.1 DUF3618 domain-containing protein [Streptomyces reniochalinae]
MPEARTPADIEADIVRRRQDLAAALDEIAVRVHPKTIMGDVKAKAAAAVDRTAGRAYVVANRTVTDVRSQFVTEEGNLRLERVVPVAVLAVAAIGGTYALTSRRKPAGRAKARRRHR